MTDALCGFGESDGVATQIVNGVELPEENVANDPNWAERSRNCGYTFINGQKNVLQRACRPRGPFELGVSRQLTVKAGERRDAGALDLEDVVLGIELVTEVQNTAVSESLQSP